MDTPQEKNNKNVLVLVGGLALLAIIVAAMAYNNANNQMTNQPATQVDNTEMTENNTVVEENNDIDVDTTTPVEEREDYITTRAQLNERLDELEGLVAEGKQEAAQAYVTLLRKNIELSQVDAEAMFKADLDKADAELEKMENSFMNNTDDALGEIQGLITNLRQNLTDEQAEETPDNPQDNQPNQ
jgi:hypothetical protein